MIDPIYQSKRQRIWRLDANHGVSLVRSNNGTYSLVTVMFHQPENGPSGGMSVDYSETPQDGLSESDALAKVEQRLGGSKE